MNETEITARLRGILGDIAPDLNMAAIGPNDDLRNDIGLDSMDFLNFVIATHKQLGVDVPEAHYGKITTLGKFAAYIAGQH